MPWGASVAVSGSRIRRWRHLARTATSTSFQPEQRKTNSAVDSGAAFILGVSPAFPWREPLGHEPNLLAVSW